ncbi:uncharacterized protein LOC119512195 [Choloepus didactylus]|uniref:uncharacterized protein LOC119512195 n=1 Tax=Choloepus didactylus TaxID=27675 RepID=UPI00189C9FF4|nr:uncharacterized protein LOC119512195 [Choloepus didactylus]
MGAEGGESRKRSEQESEEGGATLRQPRGVGGRPGKVYLNAANSSPARAFPKVLGRFCGASFALPWRRKQAIRALPRSTTTLGSCDIHRRVTEQFTYATERPGCGINGVSARAALRECRPLALFHCSQPWLSVPKTEEKEIARGMASLFSSHSVPMSWHNRRRWYCRRKTDVLTSIVLFYFLMHASYGLDTVLCAEDEPTSESRFLTQRTTQS